MNKKIEEILERIEKESVRYFYSTHEEYESGSYASNTVGELIEIVKLLVEEVETLKDSNESINRELTDLWNRN